MNNETIQVLAAHIATHIIKQPKRVITPDEKILSSGLIDSFSLVDLSIFIEEHFGVRIADTELNPETFDTLAQLAGLITQRQ
ncbi:MAG TPA: acyl carrier protein [Anaerolineales bacterium]|nr:acyl carrier protein [Anaerolineales bacterium]